jgi:hypothetical protein
MGVQFLYIFRTWAIRYISLLLYIRAVLKKMSTYGSTPRDSELFPQLIRAR